MQTITIKLPAIAGMAKNQTCQGDFVKIESATAVYITVKTDSGETQNLPVGDGCRFDAPFKNLELSSTVGGDVVEFTYGKGLKIPATRATAIIPPFVPVDALFISNSGISSPIYGNIDASVRVGQPVLDDNHISIGTGDQWDFYYFGGAFGSFNGIWFEVTQIPAGGFGLILVPSHDLTNQSANPNFNGIGETGYLKTVSGFVPINLNDGSYLPAVGDIFYLPFDGRDSLYYRSPGVWGPAPGFNFQYHFNYGTEPCAHGPAANLTLIDNFTFNTAGIQTINVRKPEGTKGFILYVTGNFDPHNTLVLGMYAIDPVTGAIGPYGPLAWPGSIQAGVTTPTVAYVVGCSETVMNGMQCFNAQVTGALPQNIQFTMNDPNATALTPDSNVFLILEWIY